MVPLTCALGAQAAAGKGRALWGWGPTTRLTVQRQLLLLQRTKVAHSVECP